MPDKDAMIRRESDHWKNKIDKDVSLLSRKVAGFETILTTLTQTINNLASKFDDHQLLQITNNKTQWPIILSSFTLIVIIIGGFMNGYVRDLERIEDQTSELTKSFINHIKDGHPNRVQDGVLHNMESIKLLNNNFEVKIIKLDETLQREMRLLDDTSDTRIENLDRRLQREFGLIRESLNLRDSEFARRLSTLEHAEMLEQ